LFHHLLLQSPPRTAVKRIPCMRLPHGAIGEWD
jgi:hypothetical protein